MKDDLISRQAALDWLEDEWDGMVVHVFDGIKNIPSAHCDNCPYPDQHVPQEDAVNRKELKHIFETWLTVKGYNDSERNMIKAVLYELQYARSVIASAQPDNDRIWEALSKVYNMADVPDEAKAIIGDVMLGLDEPPAQFEYTEQDMREQFNAGFACGMQAAQSELAQDLPDACADAISRKATIDAILAVTGNSSVRELYEHVQEHGLSDMWSGGVNAAIDIIIAVPSAQPEQRWIPWYSGKFPEESGTYTVTAYDGATERVTYAKYQKRLKRWELVGARAYWRVLAWMPLPEPYRAERREE